MRQPSRFTRSLLVGIAVVFPVGILAWLAVQFGRRLWNWGEWLFAFAGQLGIETTLLAAGFVVGVFVASVAILIAIGEVARHRWGETAIEFVDTVFLRVPGVGPLYAEFRRTRAIIEPGGETGFTDVVAVELVDDVQLLGFVVGSTSSDIGSGFRDDVEWFSVYLPLGPNPLVGGHLVHVTEDRFTRLDVDVRTALSRLITLDSGGRDDGEETDSDSDGAGGEGGGDGEREGDGHADRTGADGTRSHPDEDPLETMFHRLDD